MNREDDRELWDLLGQAPEAQISPFFSRNVMRQIRQAPLEEATRKWFGLRSLAPVAGLAVALVAVVCLRIEPSIPASPEAEPSDYAAVSTQDSELIADLDDLFASDDGNSLDDSAIL